MNSRCLFWLKYYDFMDICVHMRLHHPIFVETKEIIGLYVEVFSANRLLSCMENSNEQQSSGVGKWYICVEINYMCRVSNFPLFLSWELAVFQAINELVWLFGKIEFIELQILVSSLFPFSCFGSHEKLGVYVLHAVAHDKISLILDLHPESFCFKRTHLKMHFANWFLFLRTGKKEKYFPLHTQ